MADQNNEVSLVSWVNVLVLCILLLAGSGFIDGTGIVFIIFR